MEDSYTDEFFTEQSIDAFIKTLRKYYPVLDIKKFKDMIYDSDWNSLFIMKKMRHVTQCMHKVLPVDFEKTIEILLKAAPELEWWENICLPDYVCLYGHDYWDLSMSALTEFTKHGSSEFAIRPFLIKEPEKTAAYLEKIAGHENENVRRYASEGCRPSHPWGIGLPCFKKDPSLILPILEKLKNDESEFVRRSVANNLNAISKDNPETVIEIAERWYGKSPNTDWLVKHACRTLLKKGNRQVLELFGFGNLEYLKVLDFHSDKKSIKLGERMEFSFLLDVKSEKDIQVRLEYGIYYLKANGSHSRKVWKIAEKIYEPGIHQLTKRHHFVDRTTRKHYEGAHSISIIVNGEEMATKKLQLSF